MSSELLVTNGEFTVRKGFFLHSTQENWEELSDKIIDWNVARKEKEYHKADNILKELKEKGYKLDYHAHYATGEKLEKPYFTLENI